MNGATFTNPGITADGTYNLANSGGLSDTIGTGSGGYSGLVNLSGAPTGAPTMQLQGPSQTLGTQVDPYLAAQQAAQAKVDAQNSAYRQQYQSQYDQLDPQQAMGLQNIGNSYNQNANRLDEQNAVAKRNYDTSMAQNTAGYASGRNSIQNNTRAQANALQRLLGINGSGNSSAAYEQAPYAAGLQGTQALAQAQQTYGNNAAGLDTSWQDTQRGYKNAFDDLNTQKYQQENGLRSSIAQTKASLLGKLGSFGDNPNQYGDQINSLLSQITSLGQQYANPVMRTSDVSFKAPTAANYSLGNMASPQQQAQGGAASDLNPAFLGLLGGQRDQYGQLIQG